MGFNSGFKGLNWMLKVCGGEVQAQRAGFCINSTELQVTRKDLKQLAPQE